MIWNILIVIGTFLVMEGITWLTHKYVMHGFLWSLHKDHHHKEHEHALEKNDYFFSSTPNSFLMTLKNSCLFVSSTFIASP